MRIAALAFTVTCGFLLDIVCLAASLEIFDGVAFQMPNDEALRLLRSKGYSVNDSRDGMTWMSTSDARCDITTRKQCIALRLDAGPPGRSVYAISGSQTFVPPVSRTYLEARIAERLGRPTITKVVSQRTELGGSQTVLFWGLGQVDCFYPNSENVGHKGLFGCVSMWHDAKHVHYISSGLYDLDHFLWQNLPERNDEEPADSARQVRF
jgi:hypothetical protein